MSKENKNPKKRNKAPLIVILVIMLVGVGVSLFGLIRTFSGYAKDRAAYEELENQVSIIEESAQTEGEEDKAQEVVEESKIKVRLNMNYEELKDINPDYMGWIYYEPLEISYPVVMDRGDGFYENHAFDTSSNSAGAIFADYLCKPNLTSFNTIIYGHNMRDNSMFGALNNLIKDETIIESDPYFYIYTEKEALMYQIFAAYYAPMNSKTYDIKLDYSTNERKEYIEYIDGVAEYRNQKTLSVDTLDEDTRICTLSTCHGLRSGNRTIIHGVLIARESLNQ